MADPIQDALRRLLEQTTGYWGYVIIAPGASATGRFSAIKAKGGAVTLTTATVAATGSSPSGAALVITQDDVENGHWTTVAVDGASAGTALAYNMAPDIVTGGVAE